MRLNRLAAWLGVFAAGALFSGAASAADREIVLATWGGTWGKAITEQAIAPFEKATGVKVKVISGVSLANMQMVAAQRANPQIDLIMSTSQDAVNAYGDGLLAPLDPKDVPSLANLPEFGVRRDSAGKPMFAGMWIYPYGIAFRTDKVNPEIKCWKDLWNPRLKNKVGVSSPKYMSGYFLLMSNKMAGGTEANVTPGIDSVKTMGPNLLAVIDDSAAQQRLLAQGEVWAVPMLSSAAYKLVDEGVPAKFVIPCEGAPAGLDVISLVKNGPNPADAKKFIDFYISAGTIAAVTNQLKITPVNSQAKITPEHAKYTVSKDDWSKLVSFSEQAIIKDRARWQDAWDREIAPMTKR
jgi:putative spermidine/putrescine transport system substrate-binding protein